MLFISFPSTSVQSVQTVITHIFYQSTEKFENEAEKHTWGRRTSPIESVSQRNLNNTEQTETQPATEQCR